MLRISFVEVGDLHGKGVDGDLNLAKGQGQRDEQERQRDGEGELAAGLREVGKVVLTEQKQHADDAEEETGDAEELHVPDQDHPVTQVAKLGLDCPCDGT